MTTCAHSDLTLVIGPVSARTLVERQCVAPKARQVRALDLDSLPYGSHRCYLPLELGHSYTERDLLSPLEQSEA